MSCYIKLSAVFSAGVSFQKASCFVGSVSADSKSLSSMLINMLISKLSAGVSMRLYYYDFYCLSSIWRSV